MTRNKWFVLLLLIFPYGLVFSADLNEQGAVKQRIGQYLAQQTGGLFDVWEKEHSNINEEC